MSTPSQSTMSSTNTSESDFSDYDCCSEYITASTTPSDSSSGSLSPKTPVEFNGDAAVFDPDVRETTVTFPPYSDMIPSETNGRVFHDVRAAVMAPRTTMTRFSIAIHRKARSIDMQMVSEKLLDFKESAAEEVNARLNRAFEGRDVVEMGNRVVDFFPEVTIPSRYRLEQAFDSLSDAVQGFVARNPSNTPISEQPLHGDQWQYARLMGAKARRALVDEGICREYQIVPSHANLEWRSALDHALVNVFLQNEQDFGFQHLAEMQPLWVVDLVKKVWRLEIDTMMVDVEESVADILETPIHLQTDFELPQSFGSVPVEAYALGAAEDEDEMMQWA